MSIWLVAVLVIAAVGLAPALHRAAVGSGPQRLIGLQFASSCGLMIIIALSMAAGQSSYLIVSVVLALLSAAGLLVFSRLLSVDGDDSSGDESRDDHG